MKRRNFISGLVGAIAAAAVSARLVREEPTIEAPVRRSCLNDFLLENSDRIIQDIYRKEIGASPWLKLIPKEKWHGNLGRTG